MDPISAMAFADPIGVVACAVANGQLVACIRSADGHFVQVEYNVYDTVIGNNLCK